MTPAPPLQRGARQLSDQLLADLADIESCLDALRHILVIIDSLPPALIKFNPELVADRHRQIVAILTDQRHQGGEALAAARRRIREDLAAALARHQRNGLVAGLPARVEHLEAQVASLRAQVADAAASREPPLRLVRTEGEG